MLAWMKVVWKESDKIYMYIKNLHYVNIDFVCLNCEKCK